MSFYAEYDAQNWRSVCDEKATTANFTINMCATNATAAAALLHAIHLTDAKTVGTFLGGQNFTSCAALGSNATTPNTTTTTTTGNATRSGGVTETGGANALEGAKIAFLSSALLVTLGLMLL